MKGSIQPGHIPLNKYQLLFVGVPLLTAIEVSGLEEELATIELPDNTRVSGGKTGPTEFTMMIPAHHSVEIAAMETWFREGQDPVTPTYKKAGSLIMQSGTLGGANRTFQLIGTFPKKRKLPNLEIKNEGEMVNYEWGMCVDQIIPGG